MQAATTTTSAAATTAAAATEPREARLKKFSVYRWVSRKVLCSVDSTSVYECSVCVMCNPGMFL